MSTSSQPLRDRHSLLSELCSPTSPFVLILKGLLQQREVMCSVGLEVTVAADLRLSLFWHVSELIDDV